MNLAYTKPVDFLMRNIGPERTDEFGELVFATPILLNYQRTLVARLIEEPGFSFAAYHATQSPGPSHLEYLLHGIVALFDPEPSSWIRVAANFGLATCPFTDGTTLQREHFQAPYQAAAVVAQKPIAARTIIRRQMERIEMARRWVGTNLAAIDFIGEDRPPITLLDVYRCTPAATIRGQATYFADIVANNVVSLLSEHVEASLAPEDSRFGYLRRHLPAYTRGFDARSDRVVDIRAVQSVQFGRNLSDGLRRFENGGLYVGGVSQALAELGSTVNALHHALDNVPSFVRNVLLANGETDVAAQLNQLFDTRPKLTSELFRESPQFEFFSRTQIQTSSAFDLMRSVLFNVVQAMQPTTAEGDSIKALLGAAKTTLRRLLELGEAAAPPNPEMDQMLTAARHFEREFDTLTRVIRQIVVPLHMARMLSKPQSSFRADYVSHLKRPSFRA